MIKHLLTTVIAILAFAFNGCNKEDEGPSLDSKFLGNWAVVDESYQGSVVTWGFYYVASIKLYEDKSFKLNIFEHTADDPNSPKQGTWKYLSDKKSILFYSSMNGVRVGTILRDTTEFKISLDSNEKLVLENDWIKILHQKLNN